ncbi:MAG: hypothetical protein ABMA02_12835 [Saprospiraceae bacterium]
MRPTIRVAIFSALLFSFGKPAFAQEVQIPADTTQLSVIQTKDGNEFVGYVTRIEAGNIVIRTEKFGEVRVQRQNVRNIRPVEKTNLVEGEYWPESAQSTHYFFGTNGYGLRKGQGVYQNTWVFFNQVSYGFSDNFSIGVGIVPLFLFSGASSPIWITPKVSIPIKRDQVNLGVGALVATVAGENSGSFGQVYGQLTLGSRDRNINFGLGYGYAGNDWANTPLVSVSGIFRTGKKFALMTENYIFDTGDRNTTMLSFGGRFIGRRISVDAGLFFPTNTDGNFVAVPWLGLSVPFGQ